MNDTQDGQSLYAPLFFMASAGWIIYQGDAVGTLNGAMFLVFGMIGAAIIVGFPANVVRNLLTRLFAGTSANGEKRAAILVNPPLLLVQAVASYEVAQIGYRFLFA